MTEFESLYGLYIAFCRLVLNIARVGVFLYKTTKNISRHSLNSCLRKRVLRLKSCKTKQFLRWYSPDRVMMVNKFCILTFVTRMSDVRSYGYNETKPIDQLETNNAFSIRYCAALIQNNANDTLQFEHCYCGDPSWKGSRLSFVPITTLWNELLIWRRPLTLVLACDSSSLRLTSALFIEPV